MAEQDTAATVSVPLEWLPWHAGARARLETAAAGGRLPHGLLLHGPEGVGKELFACSVPGLAEASRLAAPARSAP